MKKSKVFGIGFHKTATTSLKIALHTLGYNVTGPNGVNDPDIRNNINAMVEKISQKFDAFQDNPWPIVFKRMDEMHPGSKFILTTRNPDEWIRSQVRHFGIRTTPMREMIYGVGCPAGNEDVFVRRMLTHNSDVIDYFRGRSKDLLVIDITREGNWEPICSFLDEPVPTSAFPHANRAVDREERRLHSRRLVWIIQRAHNRLRHIMKQL